MCQYTTILCDLQAILQLPLKQRSHSVNTTDPVFSKPRENPNKRASRMSGSQVFMQLFVKVGDLRVFTEGREARRGSLVVRAMHSRHTPSPTTYHPPTDHTLTTEQQQSSNVLGYVHRYPYISTPTIVALTTYHKHTSIVWKSRSIAIERALTHRTTLS